MARTARTLFIGDVHGCRAELEALLEACHHVPTDRVVLVGDLVAKGPDSAGVVALARQLGALAVLGNHDRHVLRRRGAGRSELEKLKPEHREVVERLSEADWRYLASLPRSLRFPEWNLIVVHAGLMPGIPLEAQKEEHLLFLRSLTPDGKGSKRMDEGSPWASHWTGPEKVVFGHDARRGLQRHPFALGLDTGCVYGGALTAWVMPEDRLVAVKAKRRYFVPA